MASDSVVESVTRGPKRLKTTLSFSVTDQRGKTVLKGSTSGHIPA